MVYQTVISYFIDHFFVIFDEGPPPIDACAVYKFRSIPPLPNPPIQVVLVKGFGGECVLLVI